MTLRDGGAFRRLAEESRMRVFLGLVRARLDRWRLTDFVEATVETPAELGPVLSFSELKERAGIEDSGLFNYHLGELEGEFVEKTDDGYRLTRGGIELSAVLAEGWHDVDVERMESPLDGECPICGESVKATYENGEFSVACRGGHTLAVDSFPPAIAREDPIETVRRKHTRRTVENLCSVVNGICPKCSASVDPAVVTVPDEEMTFYGDGCDACGTSFVTNHRVIPLADPRVRAFYADHGQAFPETPIWRVDLFEADRWSEDFEGEHAKRFETERGEDRLVVEISGTGIERVTREP